jgi:hypothetical protein
VHFWGVVVVVWNLCGIKRLFGIEGKTSLESMVEDVMCV